MATREGLSPDAAHVVASVMERMCGPGVELAKAAAGAEAVAQAEAQSPRLIILDLALPDEDGLTTLSQVRELPAR